jgi:hypothetical protein
MMISIGTDLTSSFGGEVAGVSTRLAGIGAAVMGSDTWVEVEVEGVVLVVEVLEERAIEAAGGSEKGANDRM